MFGSQLTTLETIAVAIIPMVYAVVLHEIAHGWVAWRLGDDTAYRMGRLTLNPISHIDPIGTILVPLVLLLVAGFAFGWAKPVPVNFSQLRHPRRDMAVVAAAGPAANLIMAIFWIIIIKLAAMLPESTGGLAYALFYMALFGVLVNIVLMLFNLIPIPPADGGRIAAGVLPPKAAQMLSRIEPYGLIILVVLLATGIIGKLLQPVIQSVLKLVQTIIGAQ
jgi:Zn-dependent protease